MKYHVCKSWICKSFCILQHGYFSNIHCTRIRGRYTRHRCAYNIFSMFCCVLLLLLLLPTSTCCSLLLQCMCWLWVVCWFHLPHYVFLKVLVNMFSSTSFLFYSSATYACVCKSIMKKSFPCVSNLYFCIVILVYVSLAFSRKSISFAQIKLCYVWTCFWRVLHVIQKVGQSYQS